MCETDDPGRTGRSEVVSEQSRAAKLLGRRARG